MKKISKDILLLSIGFLLMFFAYASVQQYLTVFFSESGSVNFGYISLILVYLSYVLFSPFSALIVSKIGAKKSMIISSLFYSFFIFSLTMNSIILIYISSILLGAFASLLWTAQSVYLIRVSEENSYGKNSGFFNSLLVLGIFMGVVLLSFLLKFLSFKSSFLFFSIFPIISFLIFFKLKKLKTIPIPNRLKSLRKSFTNKTILKLSLIWFSFTFAIGLNMGIIPLKINLIFGIFYVGIFSSLFYLSPFLFSYFVGKYSDKVGRKKMIILLYLITISNVIILYFTREIPFLLILSILLLALGQVIYRPVLPAFIGDISNNKNLSNISALFLMVGNMGVVSALILSSILEENLIYLVFMFILLLSLFIILPLFRLDIKLLREKISKETQS